MKKVLLSILAIVYLATASGMTLHFHYCMDKLVSWGLQENTKSTCSFCGMQKTSGDTNKQFCKGCCKDEIKVIQLKKDHNKTAEIIAPFHWSHDALLTCFATSFNFVGVSKIATANAIHGPPAKGQLPVFLLNCVFRI
jgi:hypothetical protein